MESVTGVAQLVAVRVLVSLRACTCTPVQLVAVRVLVCSCSRSCSYSYSYYVIAVHDASVPLSCSCAVINWQTNRFYVTRVADAYSDSFVLPNAGVEAGTSYADLVRQLRGLKLRKKGDDTVLDALLHDCLFEATNFRRDDFLGYAVVHLQDDVQRVVANRVKVWLCVLDQRRAPFAR